MIGVAAHVVAPVVGPDAAHLECACVGLLVALPDGTLQLYADRLEDLEALGWGILAAVEEIRTGRAALPAPSERAHAHG